MKLSFLILILISNSALANLNLAPPDFDSRIGRSIFVDFSKANYEINFDLKNQIATVKTKIVFEAKTKGKPIFDLVPNPSGIKLNGSKVNSKEIELPGKVSKVRVVDQEVSPGIYQLEMTNEITKNVSFDSENNRVSCAFWIRDLKDRLFLEQYLPTNLEFDQYQMDINVNFSGVNKIDQDFYTNGIVIRTSPTSWRINFPSYFTTSSLYFHTTPKGAFRKLESFYKTESGKEISIIVYTMYLMKTSDFEKYAHQVMKELEYDYGEWSHPSLVAYGTLPGMGGMEHSGAAQTSLAALDHEMLHSYFAKGIMPANGNSGWIDEGIASWRDQGYQRSPVPQFTGSNLGGQSVYKRNTDDRCYDLGGKFMAYLDYRLQDKGGLKAFLKGYFAAYKHTVITQEHFKNNLEFFGGIDLSKEFQVLIWGTDSASSKLKRKNSYHKSLSQEQLNSLL